MHDLDGDFSVEALVEGEVDGRHPAVREVREHAVAAVEHPPDDAQRRSADVRCDARRHGGSLRSRSTTTVQAGPHLEWAA